MVFVHPGDHVIHISEVLLSVHVSEIFSKQDKEVIREVVGRSLG
jgi:hypothetical protein